MREHLVGGTPVFGGKHIQHRGIRHWVGVGAQFGEFVAEALRQNLGAHRQNLAHFDERGTERLEHEAHLDRSQAVQHVELLDDSGDLPQSFDLATARQMVARGEIVPASEQCQRFVGYARSRLGNGLLERVRRVDGPVRRRLTFGFRRRQNRVDPAGKRGRL